MENKLENKFCFLAGRCTWGGHETREESGNEATSNIEHKIGETAHKGLSLQFEYF